MTLALHVDAARWRAHLEAVVASADVVPVVKGNGYGFGPATLARVAAELGVGTLAVGTYDELPEVRETYPGDLLVLRPWRPWDGAAAVADPRVVSTVSRLEDLLALTGTGTRPRIVVEVLTSMRRHGIDPAELPAVAPLLESVDLAGWALHLPLTGDVAAEARALARQAQTVRPAPLWVSHLPPGTDLQLRDPSMDGAVAEVRHRIGTSLWLGARSALTARARVLDVHRVRRGEAVGYRHRKAPRDGVVLVVGGGTAHGIGLEAPTAATSLRQRGVAVAKGGLAATGRALSPYTVAGAQRWFAEPPHMQCSLLWLPASVPAPAVGDWVDVDVRLTTTAFDEVVWDPAPAPAVGGAA